MKAINRITSRVVVLPVDHIDTDQIIPARYLKVTDRNGLGSNLFADWRYLPDGSLDPAFVLNQPQSQDANILLAGDNFGCGSSREHAPWALLGFGFQAVLSTSFADIFRNNALKNGLLPIVVTPDVHQSLKLTLAAEPRAELTIDLSMQELTLPDGTVVLFPIDSFSRTCLLNGIDELGYLLNLEESIHRYESSLA